MDKKENIPKFKLPKLCCRNKCVEKIPYLSLFKQFWSFPKHYQDSYLAGCMIEKGILRWKAETTKDTK